MSDYGYEGNWPPKAEIVPEDDELYTDEEGFEDDYELTDSEEDDEMCYHCDGTGQKGKRICPRCDGSGRLDL